MPTFPSIFPSVDSFPSDFADSDRLGGVRENPPLRLSVNVQPPSGQPFRWGCDQPKPADVPAGLSFSTTAPGGFESLSLTLPRKPKLSYPDLERLSNVSVQGAGQVAWEGRIQSTPRDSGAQMAVSPQMVGWQAHLEDNKDARGLYVDRDLGGWGPMSRALRLAALVSSTFNTITDPSVEPDKTTGIPGVSLTLGATNVDPLSQAFYDAGPGLTVASIYYDYSSASDAGDSATIGVADDDLESNTEATADLVGGANASGTGTFTATIPYRFGTITFWLSGTVGAVDRVFTVRRISVWGDHGLTKRGTAPDDGLYASDVIGHALSSFAPLLRHSSDTISDSGFIIPHLVFRDPTTAATIITEANRFHLNDWFIWEGQRPNEPTFYYHPRGARGKAWRARVGPSGLSETGQSMDRLWNGVVVRYQDVDGSSKTIGPTGSLSDLTTDDLLDDDPLNPANKLGIRRWQLLDMNGVSTWWGAVEVGRRFLQESKALDTSGRADISGYVEDDRGTRYPAWRIRAGDTITFLDAADPSARRVVKTSYSDDSKVNSIDLDAPPESLDALLDRLGVVLVQFGL